MQLMTTSAQRMRHAVAQTTRRVPSYWRIPPELRDGIIDQLYADRAALKACSLTCRAWLPRSRHHLFRKISIEHGHTSDAFSLLVRSTPAIANYIREIEISDTHVVCAWWEATSHLPWPTLGPVPQRRTEVHDTVSWLQRVFLPTTPPLLHVESLRLVGFTVSSAAAQVLLPHLRGITALTLDGCKAPSFADLIDFLRAFPALDTLRLLAVQWIPRSRAPVHTPHAPFPRLRRLEVSRKIDFAQVVAWVLAHAAPSVAALASLECMISGQGHASAVRDLLHAAGPALERLKIGFLETRDPTDALQATHLDLAPCTGLRHLHLICSTRHRLLTQPACRPSFSWIVLLLSTAVSPRLRSITFTLAADDLQALNLEGLDVVLAQPRFAGLREVCFEVEEQSHVLAWTRLDQVHSRMSSLNKRGVIRFSAMVASAAC
ncbi:hypothetical protein WOLCODRAFT_137884 [Wolfiporia cocos MD-104 SS10]|uniref:F-box domain-containing protein n=1 Tax=Wolfiporia cocos (strain MD-104) TaxID=742152 RepID=A0A2H3JKK4_WOLCO|nr:hypothetical protein WOLCODRAFT_137884 [Wolfiporia cocos MD-104 SS10]